MTFFKKIIGLFLIIVIGAVAFVGIDYACGGSCVELVDNLFNLKRDYKIGDDTVSLSQFTSDNTEIILKADKNGYHLNSGAEECANTLSAHSACLDNSKNGALADGYDYVEVIVSCNYIDKLYLSTGYRNQNATVWYWFDTGNNVIETDTADVAIANAENDVIVTRSENSKYQVRLYLKKYYAIKSESAERATILLSYLATDTITISDIKYYLTSDTVHDVADGLTVYGAGFVFEGGNGKIIMKNGFVNTSKQIDKIMVYGANFGAEDVAFSAEELKSDSYNYFNNRPKNFGDVISSIADEDVTVTVRVYIEYDGAPYKVYSADIFVPKFSTYCVHDVAFEFEGSLGALILKSGSFFSEYSVKKLTVFVSDMGGVDIAFDQKETAGGYLITVKNENQSLLTSCVFAGDATVNVNVYVLVSELPIKIYECQTRIPSCWTPNLALPWDEF